jgi:hypothetical protein
LSHDKVGKKHHVGLEGPKGFKWQFVEELHKLQESEGLHLANKLRSAHIKWKPQKMKVNLAAQALSSSVADALEYCEGKLKLPQFQGCGPTVQCICVFDHLFDVLNSRNPLARNFKALEDQTISTRRDFSMRQVSTFEI